MMLSRLRTSPAVARSAARFASDFRSPDPGPPGPPSDFRRRPRRVRPPPVAAAKRALPKSSSAPLDDSAPTCPLCSDKDPSLGQGKCRGNHALYVSTGEGAAPLFSGVVRTPDNRYVKLHDPSGDIARPEGHEMDEVELVGEWFHYGVRPPFPVQRVDRRLKDFGRHPHNLLDSLLLADGQYVEDAIERDETFPFPNRFEYPYEHPSDPRLPKGVRALDGVLCLTRGKQELFWSTVVGVSAEGGITAMVQADVPSLGIREEDVIAFPVTNVLFLKKGPHWKTGGGLVNDFHEEDEDGDESMYRRS